ncbi:putative anti-sigmaE protein [Thalassovita autumnalis]|uniref:Anti-sigmaE protein n=1 Tax=Thalassovita autumnalis TaxID=2072972 RepID=A0A0P1FW76_9RHOB|nr:hypothetical protein [Thalassovita autumnalis]CUH70173.1 putative anti-sigmaE protein [Thalassovita autumnalis]CUH73192.1 putative anti-sigmaE protein [Thalassovita autumnalis]
MTRDEISALLPFLANDTLEGAERAEVEAAVAADTALQAELTALQAIRQQMQAEQQAAYSPGEVGLARLMRSVEAEAAPADLPEKAPDQPDGIIRPVFWQVAAALLLAWSLGQAIYYGQSGSPDSPAGYQLAGDAALQIAFAPEAPEVEIRGLLLAAGVEIMAGPSALGLYELRLLDGVTLDEARSVLSASDLVDSLSLPEE